MVLIYEGTKEPVKVDDIVKTFRGDVVRVVSFREPHKPSSTGRVYVKHDDHGWSSEYFPGVIGAKWVEEVEL